MSNLQNFADSGKEVHMIPFDGFISARIPLYKSFIDSITVSLVYLYDVQSQKLPSRSSNSLRVKPDLKHNVSVLAQAFSKAIGQLTSKQRSEPHPKLVKLMPILYSLQTALLSEEFLKKPDAVKKNVLTVPVSKRNPNSSIRPSIAMRSRASSPMKVHSSGLGSSPQNSTGKEEAIPAGFNEVDIPEYGGSSFMSGDLSDAVPTLMQASSRSLKNVSSRSFNGTLDKGQPKLDKEGMTSSISIATNPSSADFTYDHPCGIESSVSISNGLSAKSLAGGVISSSFAPNSAIFMVEEGPLAVKAHEGTSTLDSANL